MDEKLKELRSVLRTIPNEFEGRDYTVEIFTEELTSLCPFRGLPDFYGLRIVYVPDASLVELKSLKFYLQGFREVGITHESLLNVIFEDLLELLKPKYLKAELYVNIRGGIRTTVRREYGDQGTK
ncbi:MAG: preQ(1) synthase [Candidatus Latescibacterota bacterium]|nr:MAG: preQ(1) synthase [Candidatus Latescibacterota bacterium]RKY74716.1 MAG: preQ(1) synthase [Candidatus Latescibacterota bacterium]HDH99887.1 preQ(1) synthase [Bacillota bacterium]